MLSINGKKFLNLPEAVQWLLDNNALPFQCKANYVADTIIAKSDIINPSPVEIKVGSLVLFADSKVGTVSGVTDSGFMVGQDYTDIGAQLNQIVGIDLDASQHLVFTMANGDTLDAGLIKELSGLSIDASQHLIATYNDGSTTDLGAIFQGNVNIAGNLTADSIIENMGSGYEGAVVDNTPNLSLTGTYMGIVKNGNKLTFTFFGKMKRTGTITDGYISYKIRFMVPAAVTQKIIPYTLGGISWAANGNLVLFSSPTVSITVPFGLIKESLGSQNYYLNVYNLNSMNLDTDYIFRFEQTFLLSDSLV